MWAVFLFWWATVAVCNKINNVHNGYDKNNKKSSLFQGTVRRNHNLAVPRPNSNPHRHGKIPNLSISATGNSYVIRHKGVPRQSLLIRRAPSATIGEPWPLPQMMTVNESRVFILSKDYKVFIRNNTCDVLENSVKRFKDNIRLANQEAYSNLVNIDDSGFENLERKYENDIFKKADHLSSIHIHVNSPCQRYPSIESDESYSLQVQSFGIVLVSKEVWGAIRGLETLSQIIFAWKEQLFCRETSITDYPRFKHRGVLIDSARHFITKDVIFDVLEGMYQNKMNVLHWHMVDDQSFTYESKIFPNLSKKGAYHPSLVYTHSDIYDIIEFARLRGVRVIPELDTPGHVYSWAMGHPELLTECYSASGKIPGYYGPLNPARNGTYEFLRSLFAELFDVFPDKYVHLGGDEVPMECWLTNPEVKEMLVKVKKQSPNVNYYGANTMKPVWEWYTSRLLTILSDTRKKNKQDGEFILWEEASKYDLNIPTNVIIQIWLGGGVDVRKAIAKGFRVLFSSCWYLDHSKHGVHWQDYYSCDPTHHLSDLRKNEDKILGGEACLWSEYITSETAMATLWPRASAAAERLWSSYTQVNEEYAGRRLQEHRCRMLRRGLQVGHINGPDYCLLNQNVKRYQRNSYSMNVVRYDATVLRDAMEPFIIGLCFSGTGAVFLFLFVFLKFKSRIFVICWKFR